MTIETKENRCVDGIVYWQEELNFQSGPYNVHLSKDGELEVTYQGQEMMLNVSGDLVKMLAERILHLENEVTHYQDELQEERYQALGDDL